MTTVTRLQIEHDAGIPTWFGVGGRADALARPRTIEELQSLLHEFAGSPVRVLGDGANLLVDDQGVDGLVLSLDRLADMREIRRDADAVWLHVGAGVNLPKLIVQTVRDGLAGLEGLAGIPATIGGAAIMNAGGAFGQFADVVRSIEGLTRQGEPVRRDRAEIDFGYRHSGLDDLIITGAVLALHPVPPQDMPALRDRLKHVMAYKKQSQPMADRSAGCCFRNPVLQGEQISAGRLIDEAGCKGLRIGGAEVSQRHANFIITHDGCRAGDIIQLMDEIIRRVESAHGITLQREVVVWRRGTTT